MLTLFEDYAKKDYSSTDCFVLAIMSHGCLDHVYSSNGETIFIRDIVKIFEKVPSLAFKPKVFLIQACQGGGCSIEYHTDLLAVSPRRRG